MADEIENENDSINRDVAVITGASSGIGRATAIEFAKQGYDVVLVARREEELRKVAEECEIHEVRTLIHPADTTDESAVESIATAALSTFGRFDIWVNGAAVSLFAKFEDAPMEDYRKVIETNLFGYIYGSRAAIRQFKAQGYGTLINISSVVAAAPQPYTSAYVTSKYAIRGLCDSLRMELELEGMADKVKVCNVMPASVDTNLFQNAANYTNREVVALEPVYDASYVAKQIVGLADHPKREVIIGPAGKMMAMEHTMMPWLYEKFTTLFYDRNHLGKAPAESTSGNLHLPSAFNTGVRGGWREKRLRADTMNMAIGGAVAGIGALIGIGYAISQMNKGKHASNMPAHKF